MTSIRENCPCGARVRVRGDDPGPAIQDWRDGHPCDRRDTEPEAHDDHQPAGFAALPPAER